MKEIITVPIGDYRVARAPIILKTILGSCVGVLIYDKVNRIGGLSHVYLPESKDYREKVTGDTLSHKFADVLIPLMIKEMVEMESKKRFFMSYIVGGASLFNTRNNALLNIGEKNLVSVRSILQSEKIPFMELQVGGNTGRRVMFNLMNGDIDVVELSKTSSE